MEEEIDKLGLAYSRFLEAAKKAVEVFRELYEAMKELAEKILEAFRAYWNSYLIDAYEFIERYKKLHRWNVYKTHVYPEELHGPN